MSEWDKKYASIEYDGAKPPSFLLSNNILTLPKGKALDIACGTGRNAIFLAQHGFSVDAIDASKVAIEKGKLLAGNAGVDIHFINSDLEIFFIPEKSYDLIINFNYLQRSLIPSMIKGLKKGGKVLFETYTNEQKKMGPPNNPDYLLAPNELLNMFSSLHINCYREGIVSEGGVDKAVASLIATLR